MAAPCEPKSESGTRSPALHFWHCGKPVKVPPSPGFSKASRQYTRLSQSGHKTLINGELEVSRLDRQRRMGHHNEGAARSVGQWFDADARPSVRLRGQRFDVHLGPSDGDDLSCQPLRRSVCDADEPL